VLVTFHFTSTYPGTVPAASPSPPPPPPPPIRPVYPTGSYVLDITATPPGGSCPRGYDFFLEDLNQPSAVQGPQQLCVLYGTTVTQQFPAFLTDVTVVSQRGFKPNCPAGYSIGRQDFNANTTSGDLVYLCTKADHSGTLVVQDVDIARGSDTLCPPLFTKVPVNMDSGLATSPPVYLCKQLVDVRRDPSLPGGLASSYLMLHLM
jgi:hypothetical protein